MGFAAGGGVAKNPPGSAPSDGTTTPTAALDETALECFITQQMEELRVPGVVAIVDREEFVFTAGYGWADLDRQIPMNPDTVTNVA